MSKFTVIGYYPDTSQRFALHVEADTADEAEGKCAMEIMSKNRSIVMINVVAVVQGFVDIVDTEEYVQEFTREELINSNS